MKQVYITFYNHTKIILFLLGVCFSIYSVSGQSTHTEYFMSSSYFKTSLNPALRPERGYIGIPGVTNLSIGYNTNTFALDHFLFPGVGENGKSGLFLNENVSYDQFMKGISDQNYLNFDLNETLLGFGFYAGKAFLSFDASIRANVEVDIPKDVFNFLKKGVTLDGTDKVYDLGNINADAVYYGQIGVGGSYPLLDNSLLVGAKAKVLLGLGYGCFKPDKIKINVGQDQWSAESQMAMQIVLPGLKAKYKEDGQFNGFDTGGISLTSINGFGLGLDLGATFKPGILFDNENTFFNNLTVSAAVTDLGFINWNKSYGLNLATGGEPVVIFGDKEISFENSEDLFGDLEENLSELYNFQEKPDEIEGKTNLKGKFTWGIDYAFTEKNINVGLVSTTYFNTTKALSEFTIGGAIRPVNGIEAGLSYSFAYGQFQTIGLALHLGSFFYISSDYLFPKTNSQFMPVSAKAFNVQLGFAVPIGKKHSERD